MKVQNIHNVNRFFDAVHNTNGSVELVMGDHQTINLKEDPDKLRIFTKAVTGNRGNARDIELKFSDNRDLFRFMRQMMNGEFSDAA